MRLPLVTLSGQSFASRMAGRLLAAVGAQDGVATTLQDYVEKAVALATDRSRYDAYKALFTDEAWAGTIGNIGKFTEEFEQSLASIVLRPPAVPDERLSRFASSAHSASAPFELSHR